MLQALIFDVDGTLADTECDGHRLAFNQAFQEAGLDWNWSVACYGNLLTVTGGKERIRYYVENYQPHFMQGRQLIDFARQLHQRKTYYYLNLLQQGRIPLRSGVVRLLQEARQSGLRLAIATTTTPANVDHLLTHTLGEAALDWFEVIAAGDIVPAKKPAPDIYHYVLTQMQLKPSDCLAVEDSAQGLQAACSAGMKTVVTVNDYTREQDFAAASLVVDSLGDECSPMQVLQGDAQGSSHVDLALLQHLAAR